MVDVVVVLSVVMIGAKLSTQIRLKIFQSGSRSSQEISTKLEETLCVCCTVRTLSACCRFGACNFSLRASFALRQLGEKIAATATAAMFTKKYAPPQTCSRPIESEP